MSETDSGAARPAGFSLATPDHESEITTTRRRGLPDASRISPTLMLIMTAVALSVAHGWRPIPTSEQHRSLLWALAQGGNPQLLVDPLTETADAQPVFTFLVTPLLDLFGDAGPTIAWFGAAILLFGSLWWLTGGTKRSRGQNLLWLGLMTAASSPIAAWAGFTTQHRPGGPGLLAGLADTSILGESLTTTSARALAVAGLALAVRGARPLTGTAAILAAAIIDPGFAAGALVIAGAVAAIEMPRKRSSDHAVSPGSRRRALVLRSAQPALIAIGSIIAVAANRSNFSLLWNAKGEPAAKILTETTRAAVASPLDWPIVGTIVVAVLIAATIYVTRSEHRRVARRTGQIVIVASMLSALATLATIISGRSSWVLLFPWQAMTVTVPVAVALIADRVAATIDDRAFESVIVRLGSGFVAAVIGFSGIAAGLATPGATPAASQPKLVDRLQASTDGETSLRESGVGLVHPDLGELRLNARVPISGGWNAAPSTARAVITWYESNDHVTRSLRDPEAACDLIERTEAPWVVVSVTVGWRIRMTCALNWEPQLDDEWLLLVRPTSSRQVG